MAKNSAKKELRSFENSARNTRIKDGFRFGGVGAASVWTYPIMIALMFIINAFSEGLPENAKNNEALGNSGIGFEYFYYGSMAVGLILAVIGIFRTKGRFWAIPGALLTWFLSPYTTMLFLLPFTAKIPAFFEDLWKALFGG